MRKIVVYTPGVNWRSGGQVLHGFIERLRAKITRQVEQEFNQALEEEATQYLGRDYHQRRETLPYGRGDAVCQRCGSRRRRDFSRNGHRHRQGLTLWGILTIWLPRVKCQCGGSVRVGFSLLQPYQRIWDDVIMRLHHWAALGMSLRQMQHTLNDRLQTSIGLRVLNEQLQAIKQPMAIELTSVPPVIMLDAIWVRVLRPTGRWQQDQRGRKRPVKQKYKVAVLVAIGVWPISGNWEVLDWQLADKEDRANWETLLVGLEMRGVHRQRGVELFLHDGGKGLIAALRYIHPHIPHQRCVFHKLRNIWQAIGVPDDLERKPARRLRLTIIQQAAAIYRASTRELAVALFDAFRQRWREDQPKMVETLERDWLDTIQFYSVWQKHPQWRGETLRTTSLLERVNRMLRRLFRAANSYHSDCGLLTATTRILMPYRAF